MKDWVILVFTGVLALAAVVQVVGLVLGVPKTTKVGTPDGGTYSPDGTIAITIANSKVGSPKGGDLLGSVYGRTFTITGNTTTRSNTAIDLTATDGMYGLAGNARCAPPVVTTCVEDDSSQIAYDNGWHKVNDPNASAGHFRMEVGAGTATFSRFW